MVNTHNDAMMDRMEHEIDRLMAALEAQTSEHAITQSLLDNATSELEELRETNRNNVANYQLQVLDLTLRLERERDANAARDGLIKALDDKLKDAVAAARWLWDGHAGDLERWPWMKEGE